MGKKWEDLECEADFLETHVERVSYPMPSYVHKFNNDKATRYPWLSLLTAQTVVAMIIQIWRLSFLVYSFSDPWLLIERLFRPR